MNNAREIIKNEINYFSNRGQEFEWKVYSYDKPAHLKDILEQEGFTIDPPEALMVMKLADTDHLLIASFPMSRKLRMNEAFKTLLL